VKLNDALSGVTKIFLDTSPLIYFVEQKPGYEALIDEIFSRIDQGNLAAVTSVVGLAECLIRPIRQGDVAVEKDFTALITQGQGVTFVSLDRDAALQAAALRAKYNVSLNDAFQLAAALWSSCDAFLTNDYQLSRVQEIPILILDELEL